jgi:hypothetical protein
MLNMTPEKEVARKKQLVSAAKALLSLQVGIGVRSGPEIGDRIEIGGIGAGGIGATHELSRGC